MRGIHTSGNSRINRLGNLISKSKGLAALFKGSFFKGRKISRISSPKNYMPQAVSKSFAQKQTRTQNAGLQKFTSIKPYLPQAKAAVRAPAAQLQEPAALRRLRAENELIDQLPTPPTELPGAQTTADTLPFDKKGITDKISQATTASELVQVWNHLNNKNLKELLTLEPYLTLKHACGNRLLQLCSKPDQAKVITDDTLKMIIDPKKRGLAKTRLIETRLNNLKGSD